MSERRFDFYAIDDEYCLRFNPFSLRDGIPGYERVGTVELAPPEIGPEEFAKLCAAVGPGPQSAKDRYIRDVNGPNRVNADPFCFRCGVSIELAPGVSGEHGNHQMLCPACAPMMSAQEPRG